jgi:hypothetical protein
LVRLLSAKGEWDITPPDRARITNRDRVEVCIEHFNYLRYTLSFSVAEERSEAYDYLTKLWTSVLNPSAGDFLKALAAPQLGAPPPMFLERLQIIYALATELDRAIGEQLGTFRQTGLNAQEADALAKARTDIASQAGVLARAYADLQLDLLKPENATDFERAIGGTSKIYDAVSAVYQTVSKRADVFLNLSNKTIGIEVRKVGARSAGTKVSLTLAAVDEGGVSTPMGDVNYLVQTTLPLVLHGGLAFSTLNDVKFEKIKRAVGASEEDLFQQRSDDDNSKSFTAFLGAQLLAVGGKGGDGSAPLALLFSLGTDVRSPGRTIFAGPSFAILNRVMLTAGLALGTESEGEQATLEPNVFRVVRDHTTTSPFFSLSVKVN